MANTYDQGNIVRCSSNPPFTSGGVPRDPSVVIFVAHAPDGTVTHYVYLTDSQLVRDSAGLYHVDLSVDHAGQWRYRFYSTGSYQASEQTYFIVEADTLV